MLRWNQISFSYPTRPVITDFSEEIRDGEILGVMGPSGCGKSTLLSLTAGLLQPMQGQIQTNATRLSVVFQEPRLLPWYTVRENLLAVLPMKDREERIRRALAAVELTGNESLRPDELSGGMKSRVAIARAIAFGGDLYLLDEPFAALNAELKARISAYLKELIQKSGASMMLVTHQKEDADVLADRILTLPLIQE